MRFLQWVASSKRRAERPSPLLVELFQEGAGEEVERYRAPPFAYSIKRLVARDTFLYEVLPELSPRETTLLRQVVSEISGELSPHSVEPLTFDRLIQVLEQLAAKSLPALGVRSRVRELATLSAYEAIGLSRILALAADRFVTEFYVDSSSSPLYLDHYKYGRCDSLINLTERERRAIETHMDTFRGYTLDYTSPSLKNDLEVAGARLRVSLDLAPLSVNSFSLDVRRLNLTTLSLGDLIESNVISREAAAFVLLSLLEGTNVTITGETGTGKTTLLNALDEALDPRLRRVYVEDAVETKDLLDRGYHQLKLRVDPFERGAQGSRTKGEEIVKILHRSPDIVILSEIQSDEHSQAFFHALSSGIRGLQTFHASSPEQAIRRWTQVHGITMQSLLDLGLIVQMRRPARLKPMRLVSRICEMVAENGEPRLRDIYVRDKDFRLQRIQSWERIKCGNPAISTAELEEKIGVLASRISIPASVIRA